MFLYKFALFVFVSLILDKLGLILLLLCHVLFFVFVANAVIYIIIINVHVLLVFRWSCRIYFFSNSRLLFLTSGYQPVAFPPFLFTMNLKDCFSESFKNYHGQIFDGVAYISRSFLFSLPDFYHFLFFINILFIHPFIHLLIH